MFLQSRTFADPYPCRKDRGVLDVLFCGENIEARYRILSTYEAVVAFRIGYVQYEFRMWEWARRGDDVEGLQRFKRLMTDTFGQHIMYATETRDEKGLFRFDSEIDYTVTMVKHAMKDVAYAAEKLARERFRGMIARCTGKLPPPQTSKTSNASGISSKRKETPDHPTLPAPYKAYIESIALRCLDDSNFFNPGVLRMATRANAVK